jgi:hypothetical protein
VPPGGLMPVDGPKVSTTTDPPPVNDIPYYLDQVGETIQLPAAPAGTTFLQALALAGGNYSQAAGNFTGIISDFSGVDDPWT